jgi:hypothetical protein
MIVPLIAPGMKQSDDVARIRVDARQVRAFIGVASVARPGEIVWVVATAMLPRNDVLHVKWEPLNSSRKAAIFAAVVRTSANEISQLVVHH